MTSHQAYVDLDEGNRNEWPWLTRLQYPVGQSTYLVHTDPTLFPEPYRFNPGRWVEAAQQGIPLNKYLVSFTKGSRQCLGIK